MSPLYADPWMMIEQAAAATRARHSEYEKYLQKMADIQKPQIEQYNKEMADYTSRMGQASSEFASRYGKQGAPILGQYQQARVGSAPTANITQALGYKEYFGNDYAPGPMFEEMQRALQAAGYFDYRPSTDYISRAHGGLSGLYSGKRPSTVSQPRQAMRQSTPATTPQARPIFRTPSPFRPMV